MEHYKIIGFSLFLGAIFVGGAIILSKLVGFQTPSGKRKVQPYECSENPIGGARIQFKVGYYVFALLFLIFEIESLFLFPCMKIFRQAINNQIETIQANVLLFELSIFVAILSFGLVYAWRKGVLIWE